MSVRRRSAPVIASVSGVRELEGRLVGAVVWDNEVFKEGFRLGEGPVVGRGVTEGGSAMAYLPARVRVSPARVTGVAWWVGVGRMTEEGRGDSKC